jgi:hypothetical protein
MAVSKKALDRVAANFKRYHGILVAAKARDISESDTVVIVADMLADLLGYDKYTEVTTEFAIRGTYVDLAVKVGNEVRFLLEAKAIGVDLKEPHVKQAVDYGANHGIEWIILTNGARWMVYKIHFRQPIDKSLVFDIDLLQATPRSANLLNCFGNLSKEGFTTSSMAAVFQQQQATSKFSLASLLLGEEVISVLRRELRRAYPGVKVDEEELRLVVQNEVLKREVVESEEAKQAFAALKRAKKKGERAKERASGAEPAPVVIDNGGAQEPASAAETIAPA